MRWITANTAVCVGDRSSGFLPQFTTQLSLKIMSLLSRKLIGIGNKVSAVGISSWIEIADHGEEFGGVATGTEDEQEVGLLTGVTGCKGWVFDGL